MTVCIVVNGEKYLFRPHRLGFFLSSWRFFFEDIVLKYCICQVYFYVDSGVFYASKFDLDLY